MKSLALMNELALMHELRRFADRLHQASEPTSDNPTDFERGWNEACEYFSHELKERLFELGELE